MGVTMAMIKFPIQLAAVVSETATPEVVRRESDGGISHERREQCVPLYACSYSLTSKMQGVDFTCDHPSHWTVGSREKHATHMYCISHEFAHL